MTPSALEVGSAPLHLVSEDHVRNTTKTDNGYRNAIESAGT